MRFTEVRYLKRKNLGNFEHIEILLAASPAENEDGIECLLKLKAQVDMELDGPNLQQAGPISNPPQPEDPQKTEPKSGGPIESQEKAPERKTRKPRTPKETLVAETTPDQGVVINQTATNDEAEAMVNAGEATVPAEAVVAPPKEDKPKKTLRKAGTPYARDNELHKKLVGEFLNKAFPEWKKPANIEKAKAASAAMAGKEFLDAEGLIIESFKTEFRKLMV